MSLLNESSDKENMTSGPNIVFLLADQLRAATLSIYDETNIETPNINKIAKEGVIFDNAISNCPVCTPYRAMLLTGKYPQTTGHVVNFINTRYDEIGWGDIFKKAGYSTAWIGKWHLHTGAFPTIKDARDFVPEGRSRLGFDYFRAYNFHANYFNGPVATENWHCENWDGYETKGLLKYFNEFLEKAKDTPFCTFISPHQPHSTYGKYAPDNYYDKIGDIKLPPNVPDELKDKSLEMYRNYLAMTLAIDEMVGDIDTILEEKNLKDNTIFVITSDHGTQAGSQGIDAWMKQKPWEESIHVPLIIRWPGKLSENTRNNTLVSAPDFLPSFISMCGMDISLDFQGRNLSEQMLKQQDDEDDSSVFIMNFIGSFDHLVDGNEWRGVRTSQFTYAKWLDGREVLYDNANDKYQLKNLSDKENFKKIKAELACNLDDYMTLLGDEFPSGSTYQSWFDNERRIIRNAKGGLTHPETVNELL